MPYSFLGRQAVVGEDAWGIEGAVVATGAMLLFGLYCGYTDTPPLDVGASDVFADSIIPLEV